MKDWDKDKFVHDDKMHDVPEAVRESVQKELDENALQCEECGFYFFAEDGDITKNDFYTMCRNCENQPYDRREPAEPLTWAEVYNWVYGIVQD